MSEPCMSCGARRDEMPPEGCRQKASHEAGYRAEVMRLRIALREASEELDAAGCQVAASRAHQAATRPLNDGTPTP